MFGRVQLLRASWTLIDQGIVSIGTFAVNIMLARLLLPVDYGTFAVIFGILLLLQVFNTTLIFYPLTIRIAVPGADRDDLIWSSLTLLAALLIPLSAVIAAGLLVFRQGDLVGPVLAWFLAWQLQETFRRVLFSEFRHRVAVLGDGVSYLGQSLAVVLLAAFHISLLPKIFWVLAATSALGAAIQFLQIAVARRRPEKLVATAKDYWSIGRWSLASSLTMAFRINALIWLIALAATRAEVAEFQATLNVVNLVNPILFGLCNLIPQTAANASNDGVTGAWRATRHYASLGFLPTAVYYAFLMISPETMLRIFYGAGSHYLHAGLAVQILGAAFILNYMSEMVCSFLHGINSPRAALNINFFGAVATVVVFIPLFMAVGWIGATIALAVANGIRLVLSFISIKRMVFDANARPV
jgi:O-antigen/teichoic acid export membrane protein